LIILAYFFLLLATKKIFSRENRFLHREINMWIMPVIYFFSAGMMMSAQWFPTMFDILVLLFILLAYLLMIKGKGASAGFMLGIAWFSKEIALLGIILPFFLYATHRIQKKTMVASLSGFVVLGGTYWLIRTFLVPLGSSSDLHGFQFQYAVQSILTFLESFWFQSLLRPGPTVTGILLFLYSIFSLKTWRVRGIFLFMIFLCILSYWGMLGYNGSLLITPEQFSGRFFIVPFVLALILFSLHGRKWALVPLCVAILYSGMAANKKYQEFQRAYARIYIEASTSNDLFCVHFPMKPLDDPSRNLKIGDYPSCPRYLDPKTGKLVDRKGAIK